MKTCKKCTSEKSLDDFYYHPETKDNRNIYCKSCEKENSRTYYLKNKESIGARVRKYENEKYYSDNVFRMSKLVRSRVRKAIAAKGYTKRSTVMSMVGCDWGTLKRHIESRFTDGMSWDNRGQWHIDHIVPLASANTEEELIKLCHYTNLQPLWAEDNFTKSDKII